MVFRTRRLPQKRPEVVELRLSEFLRDGTAWSLEHADVLQSRKIMLPLLCS